MSEENGSAQAPTQFDSVSDAVAELDRREAVRREEAKAAKVQTEEVAEVAEEALEAEEPQEEAAEAEEAEEVATEEETEEVEEEAPQVVNLDGKQIEIPKGTPRALVEAVNSMASELKADYTRKTQEVSAERETVRAATQQTQAVVQQLQQTHQALSQFAQSLLGEAPDLSLAQQDPQTYLVQRGLYEQRMQQFQALIGQGQQLQQQQEQSQAQQLQEARKREADLLLKAMPELSDSAKRAAFTAKAVEVGARYGISEQEIGAISDHRLILALRDLSKLQAREQSAGTVRQKLANVPPKVNKPGPASQDSGKSQRHADAKRAFLKSAKTDRDLRKYVNATTD